MQKIDGTVMVWLIDIQNGTPTDRDSADSSVTA